MPLTKFHARIGDNILAVIDTINVDLRDFDHFENPVLTLGYNTIGDGLGAIYRWDTTSTEAEDGSLIIVSNERSDGRWVKTTNVSGGSGSGAKGPKGDKGTQGIQGAKGIQGPIGPQGIQGNPGPQGAQGNPGTQGIQGNTGATGAKGETGGAGDKGDKGDTGAKGDTGDKGEEGGATGFTNQTVDLVINNSAVQRIILTKGV